MWCDSYCGPDGKTTIPSQNCGTIFCCGNNTYKYCCSNVLEIIPRRWNYPTSGRRSNVCIGDLWWVFVLPFAIIALVFSIVFPLAYKYKRQKLVPPQIQGMSRNRSSTSRMANADVIGAAGPPPPAVYSVGETTYQNRGYLPEQSSNQAENLSETI